MEGSSAAEARRNSEQRTVRLQRKRAKDDVLAAAWTTDVSSSEDRRQGGRCPWRESGASEARRAPSSGRCGSAASSGGGRRPSSGADTDVGTWRGPTAEGAAPTRMHFAEVAGDVKTTDELQQRRRCRDSAAAHGAAGSGRGPAATPRGDGAHHCEAAQRSVPGSSGAAAAATATWRRGARGDGSGAARVARQRHAASRGAASASGMAASACMKRNGSVNGAVARCRTDRSLTRGAIRRSSTTRWI
ncbi:hypothetical protein Scep_009793 [Stephania cephalantha]|uniref:Uncharacterized protein n=1 Tax=Stephania cephalantha TaxID=152367 RepID=A0AAP0JTW8_9MAGN